jgi:hypothetical protein
VGRNAGGLFGSYIEGFVGHCFWDIETSGQTTGSGTGKTTAEMHDPNTFVAAGWDYVGQADGPQDIWAEPEGGGYPILWWQVPEGYGLPVFSGGTGERDDPYRISRPEELNRIGHNPRLMKCHFKLVESLDLAGLQFYPIGSPGFPYMGVFDGNGHTASNLTIVGGENPGLFAYLADEAEVRSLAVVDANISGSGDYIGGLAGYNAGSIVECRSDGLVSGTGWCGYVGGLVGENVGRINSSYSGVSVSGSGWGWDVGGLVGRNYGSIVECHSDGLVSGTDAGVGGLAGSNHGSIVACHNEGSVSGAGWTVGGLVGSNDWGSITTSCNTGSVSGTNRVGGLVGDNDWNSSITTSYSSGSVSGEELVGGLVGDNTGSIVSSFWDIQTSGQTKSDGGTGKTMAEMQTASTFLEAGWDFVDETANGADDIWWINEGQDYPRLWWETD